MSRFDSTYSFIGRGTEQLVPQYLPYALHSEPKHICCNNENSGVIKVYKRNKLKFRLAS
jgi:hypothetical protein